MPHFMLMHEMTIDHIREDIGLMVQDFAPYVERFVKPAGANSA
jgi:hypothetical protein